MNCFSMAMAAMPADSCSEKRLPFVLELAVTFFKESATERSWTATKSVTISGTFRVAFSSTSRLNLNACSFLGQFLSADFPPLREGSRGNGERGNGSQNFSAVLRPLGIRVLAPKSPRTTEHL